MAEFETTEVDTDEVDTYEEVDSYDETSSEDSPTYEDYIAMKERLAKAERSLVDYKKKAKTSNGTTGEVVTKQDLELIRFIDRNPGYEGKEEEIKKYLKKGLGLNEIKKLVEPDGTYENREKTKAASISAGESGGSQTSYTMSEIEKLPQKEYERVMDLVDSGKAVIK